MKEILSQDAFAVYSRFLAHYDMILDVSPRATCLYNVVQVPMTVPSESTNHAGHLEVLQFF